jgi:hypothetical protein
MNKQNCLTTSGAHKLIFLNYIIDSDLKTDRKALLLTTKYTQMQLNIVTKLTNAYLSSLTFWHRSFTFKF